VALYSRKIASCELESSLLLEARFWWEGFFCFYNLLSMVGKSYKIFTLKFSLIQLKPKGGSHEA